MEFNDLVTLILLFVFFVLPSIFKGRGKKKAKIKKKKPGLFDRLGEAINNFVRELEKQALEAKKQARQEEQGTVWEEMDDREQVVFSEEPVGGPFAVPDTDGEEHGRMPPAMPPEKPRHGDRPLLHREKPAAAAPEVVKTEPDMTAPDRIRMNLPKHELQRAVVWSEILGKPVALRE